MHEVEISVLCGDAKINCVVGGRHIPLDDGLGVGTVVGNGVDVDLLTFFVPDGLGIEYTHAAPLEFEIVDCEIGIRHKTAEGCLDGGSARGFAAELHSVEVDEIKDIGHLHLIEVDA